MTALQRQRLAALMCAAFAVACQDSAAPPPPNGANSLIAAGDIGNCDTGTDEATAKLLDNLDGTIIAAGDNAYPDGSTSDYADCFDPTWGRHKDRIRPAPGNHEYNTSGAGPYYAYFGAAAGPAGKGYYSFDEGAWHIISLNSEVGTSSSSSQVEWLKADLASTDKRCVLAFWHKPRFSSGSHGNYSSMEPLWDALYAAGAEIVVNGHDHNYERFAPQTPTGEADATGGIREFVVGTGGTSLRSFDSAIPNSQVRNSGTHGVLVLTLQSDSYEWEFVPVAGKTFTDQGSGSCN